MIILAFIAGMIVGAVLLGAILFLIAWAVALAEMSEEAEAHGDVPAGLTNFHAGENSRG